MKAQKNLIVIILLIISCYAISFSKQDGFSLMNSKSKNGNDLVKTDIITELSLIKPGSEFLIGIVMTPDKGWHTYWINAGDAGLPTTIDFNLPKGVSAGEIVWEIPEKIPFAGMANYGYEHENTLIIPIKVDSIFNLNELTIEATVKWLICKEECIPGSKKVAITIPVGENSVRNNDFDYHFTKFKNNHPLANPQIMTSVSKSNKNLLILEIILPDYLNGINKLEFFPIEGGYFDNGASQEFTIIGNKAQLILKFDKYREKDPIEVYGILVSDVPLFRELPNKAIIIRQKI